MPSADLQCRCRDGATRSNVPTIPSRCNVGSGIRALAGTATTSSLVLNASQNCVRKRQRKERDRVEYARWRSAVEAELWAAGRYEDSSVFGSCGQAFGSFNVLTCEEDLDHLSEVRPLTCKLRICPDCERREQARKMAYYIPAFKALIDGDPIDGWSLKHLVLTTPYALEDQTAETLQNAWRGFEKALNAIFMKVFEGKLTKEEQRRGRISYKLHQLAMLAANEFGEAGKRLHFHILAYCPFIPKQTITDCWKAATEGECEVNWIERVDYHGVEDAVKEVAKYVTKFTELEPAQAIKLLDVLKGNRRVRSYGTIRGMEIEKPEKPACPVCAAKLKLIHVSEYVQKCDWHSKRVNPEIVPRISSPSLLDLILGNKAGDSHQPGAPKSGVDPPAGHDPPAQLVDQQLIGFESTPYLDYL